MIRKWLMSKNDSMEISKMPQPLRMSSFQRVVRENASYSMRSKQLFERFLSTLYSPVNYSWCKLGEFIFKILRVFSWSSERKASLELAKSKAVDVQPRLSSLVAFRMFLFSLSFYFCNVCKSFVWKIQYSPTRIFASKPRWNNGQIHICNAEREKEIQEIAHSMIVVLNKKRLYLHTHWTYVQNRTTKSQSKRKIAIKHIKWTNHWFNSLK